jgi:hypothetical protein
MTMKELADRVAALEAEVAVLRKGMPGTSGKDWLRDAGTFRDDPNFWDAVKAGAEYRRTHEPGRKRAKKPTKSGGKRTRT